MADNTLFMLVVEGLEKTQADLDIANETIEELRKELAEQTARHAMVVKVTDELGLTVKEAAKAFGVSEPTVWRARAEASVTNPNRVAAGKTISDSLLSNDSNGTQAGVNPEDLRRELAGFPPPPLCPEMEQRQIDLEEEEARTPTLGKLGGRSFLRGPHYESLGGPAGPGYPGEPIGK